MGNGGVRSEVYITMDTNILLESGTNELEILEFRVANNYYGINVAKIREIISRQKTKTNARTRKGPRKTVSRKKKK